MIEWGATEEEMREIERKRAERRAVRRAKKEAKLANKKRKRGES